MGASTSAKLSRLLNLVAALSETTRPLSARDLRERVEADWGDSDEAFRRGFERDKAELRDLGIEVVVEEIPGSDPPDVGYRVPRHQYALKDPGLEPDETAALHLAASLVRLEGVHGAGALWKLGTAAGEADPTGGLAALPRHPQLGPLFTAVAERRPVTFTYKGEARTLDPHRLDFARGRWYLRGRDHDKDEERLFRIDRLEGDVALGPAASFTRPPGGGEPGANDPWLLNDGEAVVARLRVDAGHAPLARTTLGEGAVIDEEADGSVVVELPVTHVDGFRSFVLGFLDHAEVLSPPALRDDIVTWLRALTGEP